MAYSKLPWRPLFGHQAWSWTTLRTCFFITFTNVFYFCHVLRFNVFYFYLNVFYIYGWNREPKMARLRRRTSASETGSLAWTEIDFVYTWEWDDDGDENKHICSWRRVPWPSRSVCRPYWRIRTFIRCSFNTRRLFANLLSQRHVTQS